MQFSKGAGPNDLKFPLTQDQLASLQKCDLASPVVGDTGGLAFPPSLANNAGLEASTSEIRMAVEQTRSGEFPRWFMEKYYPSDWGAFPEEIPALLAAEGLSFDNPIGLANVVHMDEPDDLQHAMRKWMLSIGARHKDASVKYADFMQNVVRSKREYMAAANVALETAFKAKYAYGVARPEEVAGDNFTVYPEGCPTHPSYPAGHGAAAFSGAVYFFENWVNSARGLDADIAKELFDAAYIWAMSRSLAGVHHAVDNLPYAPHRGDYEFA